VRHREDQGALYADPVLNRAPANQYVNRAAASANQCWRLNQLGLLEIRAEPGEPIPRDVVKQLLAEAVRRDLWQPEARGK
jgi:hypothetical protein